MNQPPYSLDELQLESTLGGLGEEAERSLPVISLRDYPERKSDIANELWQAATEYGFFQIADHGLSAQEIDKAFALSAEFFALPEAVKSQYPLHANAGWESRAQVRPSTGTADQKESYQLTRPHMEGKWPSEEEFAGFRSALLAFEGRCWHLGMQVLSCFADKLGFPPDFFSQAHDPNGEGYQSTLRMLHYFPLEDLSRVPENAWRAGAHTDFDCLTLLFQRSGQGGLQVCPGKEADSHKWTSVKPQGSLITCNIGDMLMRWSDDQLKSTLHRVRMPTEGEYLGSRYSLAFFCQANKPVVIQGPSKRYPPITAEEYLKQRIAANFKSE